MGHSPSIAEMAAKEKAFADWLATREQALDARRAALQKTQDADIASFYSENSWNDAKILGSGSNTDFQHQSDFTLKNLKLIIDAIGRAMFSDSAAPTGAKTDPDEAKKAVAAATAFRNQNRGLG